MNVRYLVGRKSRWRGVGGGKTMNGDIEESWEWDPGLEIVHGTEKGGATGLVAQEV